MTIYKSQSRKKKRLEKNEYVKMQTKHFNVCMHNGPV